MLNYYTPYISGLTNVARDLSEGLVRRGHSVTVLTSRHDDALPKREVLNGVHIRRSWTPASISRAPLSPMIAAQLALEQRKFDFVHLHLPLPEAGVLASVVPARKLVVTYQCDASPPDERLAMAARLLDASHRRAIRKSRRTFVSSHDYARNSRIRDVLFNRSVELPPGCQPRGGGRPLLRDSPAIHVGFLGRMVPEKGLPYLIQAFKQIEDPKARLLLAGPGSEVAGGSVLGDLAKQIRDDHRIRVMGVLPPSEVANFFSSIDVLCLPSIDPLEAFGIVQVEAMMTGVPVVATALPGVRTPLLKVPHGRLVSPRDPSALAAAIQEAAGLPPLGGGDANLLRELYGAEEVLSRYENCLQELKTSGA